MDAKPDFLSKEDFEPRIGTVFTLTAGEAELPLKLEAVKDQAELAAIGPDGKPIGNPSPFSLTFSGPKEVLLPQSLYAISHPEMEPLHLFMKPFHESEEAYFYEIGFN